MKKQWMGFVFGVVAAIVGLTAAPAFAGKHKAAPMPVDVVPGVVTIFNADNAATRYVMRSKSVGARGPVVIQDFPFGLAAGSAFDVDLNRWNVSYRLWVYADANNNGVIDSGDFIVKKLKVATSKSWSRRHSWEPKRLDVVIRGDGTGGGTNPPPTGFTSGFLIPNVVDAPYGFIRLDHLSGNNGQVVAGILFAMQDPTTGAAKPVTAPSGVAQVTPQSWNGTAWVPDPEGYYNVVRLGTDGTTTIRGDLNVHFVPGTVIRLGPTAKAAGPVTISVGIPTDIN